MKRKINEGNKFNFGSLPLVSELNEGDRVVGLSRDDTTAVVMYTGKVHRVTSAGTAYIIRDDFVTGSGIYVDGFGKSWIVRKKRGMNIFGSDNERGFLCLESDLLCLWTINNFSKFASSYPDIFSEKCLME